MKLPHNPPWRSGFTLVEIFITLFILSATAAGLMNFLLLMQLTAEKNLYNSIALIAASSVLEQLKSEDVVELEDYLASGKIDFKTGDGNEAVLHLSQQNKVNFPVISGDTNKIVSISLEPVITYDNLNDSYWLKVIYSYEQPRSNRIFTSSVKFLRSNVEGM